MIGNLKPYADYKDSGLAWLGYVPQHWHVRRIKTALQEVDRRSSEGLEPLLSLRMQAGLVNHHASGGRPIPPSALIGYKRVLPGEIVMNRMRASLGLFAAATSEGLISPDYAIFRPTGQVNVAYAVQLFRTPAMAAVFRLESTGLGTGEAGFLRLYSDQFGRLAIPVPPISEQAAIVRFLDWANRRLEGAIRAKRKVIGLLNEQKQAVIHRAVTRGLDSSVPSKPSGIDWLGDIPLHWALSPNRALLRIRKVLVGERHKQFRLLSLTKRGVIVRDLSEMRGKFSADMGTSQEVRSGDLVFCLFDVPETPRTVGLSRHEGMITGAYTVMECSDLEIAKNLSVNSTLSSRAAFHAAVGRRHGNTQAS